MFKAFGADLPAGGNVVKARTVVLALPWAAGDRSGGLPAGAARRGGAADPGDAGRDRPRGRAATRQGGLAPSVLAVASVVERSPQAAPPRPCSWAPERCSRWWPLRRSLRSCSRRSCGCSVPPSRPPARRGPGPLNATRQPRRTATTAGALMVGVALVTFVCPCLRRASRRSPRMRSATACGPTLAWQIPPDRVPGPRHRARGERSERRPCRGPDLRWILHARHRRRTPVHRV